MDFYGFYDIHEEDTFVQSFIGDTPTSVFGRSYEEPDLRRHAQPSFVAAFSRGSNTVAMEQAREAHTSSPSSWETSGPHAAGEDEVFPHGSSAYTAALESYIPMAVVEKEHELSFFEAAMPSLGRPTLQLPPPTPATYFHSPVDEREVDADSEDPSSELDGKLLGIESQASHARLRKRKITGPKFRSKDGALSVSESLGLSIDVPLPPLNKAKQHQLPMPPFRAFDGGKAATFAEVPQVHLEPIKVKQEFPLVPVKLEPSSSAVELIVERQPPVEVRTRTPSENRNFGVTVRVGGDFERLNLESIEVRLAYAASEDPVKQAILGGRKVVAVKEDGRAVFDNLSMREASTKHGEKEFCLEFLPLTRDGKALGNFGVRTNPFYAYSHMKVLTRRKCVKLRTLNKNYGTARGGEKMHVIGQPFIRGPSLSIVFSTPHGDVYAPHTELYSDSVLFFELPPYPDATVFSTFNPQRVTEVKVKVQVTNDGRAFSNPLEFTYLADSALHPMDFRG